METLQRTANRGSLSTGYEIGNSYKNENDNAEKMTHTYDSAPTSQKKGTISMWFKRTEVGSNIGLFQFGDDASGNYVSLRWGRDIYGSLETYGMRIGGTNFSVGNTYGAVRDTSAFYHVVVAIDTTQATATNRFKVYRNGVELEWSTDNRSSITQDADLAIGENGKDAIIGEGVYRYNGYIAEVNYVDGQQLTSTDFGEYDEDSGIWKPKEYTGTYGNNGFYLDFSNASNLGEDQSGNNHDFSLTNITSANQATDTPTNNFCTFNPLSPSVPTYNTVSEGGTQMNSLGNAWTTVWSSVALFKGKWYAEFKRTATDNVFIGAGGIDSNLYYYNLNYVGNNGNGTTFSVGLYSINGDFYSGTGTTGSSYATNDILCLAVDQDNGAIYFRKNNDAWMGDGTNAGNPASGASKTGAQIIDWGTATVLAASIYSSGDTVQANFGGYTSFSNSTSYSDELGMGSFVYEPPASYLAICSKNLAEYG
jgi:hypothetical protein